jgi:hypothetical protein
MREVDYTEQIRVGTPTAEEYEKYYSCVNKCGNGFESWLDTVSSSVDYALRVRADGACGSRGSGSGVTNKTMGHSPYIKINKKSTIFKAIASGWDLVEGEELTLGQKYDYAKNWCDCQYDRDDVEKKDDRDIIIHGSNINYRVELENLEEQGEEWLVIRPTNPIAFAYLYESGAFGKGVCAADEICEWFGKEFIQAVINKGLIKNLVSEKKPPRKQDSVFSGVAEFGRRNKIDFTLSQMDNVAQKVNKHIELSAEFKDVAALDAAGGIRERRRIMEEKLKKIDEMDEIKAEVKKILGIGK